MKIAVTIEDMAPAIHMGTSVDRVTRIFNLPEDICDYVRRNKQDSMTTVITFSIVEEEKQAGTRKSMMVGLVEMSDLLREQGIETKCFRDHQIAEAAYRAALDAVQRSIPDPIHEDDAREFIGWSDTNVAYRAGWNQCHKAMLKVREERS